MKSNKYPHLYVLPQKEALTPSWDETEETSTVNQQMIRKQMDKLHGISGAVFVATVLLEICIWQFSAAIGSSLGLIGTVAIIAASLIVGLIGGILTHLTSSVEQTVRQHLPSVETEDEYYV